MLQIGVQSGGIEEVYGIDGAYRVIREAGFDAVDANLDHLFAPGDIAARRVPQLFMDTSSGALKEAVAPWKEAAKKYGLDPYQAHAPFPSYVFAKDDPAYNDLLLHMLRRTIEGCDIIGCRRLIIHPFFLGYDQQLDPEQEWELNVERYAALIPTAKACGVTICLENMFTSHRGRIYAACCSDLSVACRYIDTLNALAGERRFGFCLDTGHLLLVGKDIQSAMLTLGDRIEAFHIHDNDGRSDQHLAPYMGVLDWDRFVQGLRAIHYGKTLSFETFNVWNVVDKELCPELLRFIAHTGRMFARRAQA